MSSLSTAERWFWNFDSANIIGDKRSRAASPPFGIQVIVTFGLTFHNLAGRLVLRASVKS